jgi:hypothetical protein
MAGTGICSFAKLRGQMPLIATAGIASWQTALKWTPDCQVPRSGCQEYIHAVRSSLWQSAVKFILLSVAIRAMVILFVAISSLNAVIATIRGTHLSVECGIRLKSRPRHFTSRIPLFEVSYFFAARLLQYKIRGGLFRPT